MTAPPLPAAGNAAALWRSALATAGRGTFDAHTGALIAAAAAGDPAVLLAAAAAGDPAVLLAAVRRCGAHVDLDGLNAACREVRRDRVAERLAQLSGPQLRWLRMRALLGPGVPERLAARLTHGLPGCPGLDPADPLVAEVVLAAMDGAERAALRRYTAEAANDKGLPAALVGRLLSATEPGWPGWALGALLAAAAAAGTERRWEAAVALYERALREPAADPVRPATLLALGDAQLSGAPEAAGRTYGTVLRTAAGSAASGLRMAAAGRLLVRGDDETARRELAAAYHHPAAAGASDTERAALAALYWLAVDRSGTPPELTCDRVPAPDGGDPAGRGVVAWREAVAGDDLDAARGHAFAALDPPAGAVVPLPVQVAAARTLTLTEDFAAAQRRLDGLVEASRAAGGAAAGPLAARAELWLRTGRLDDAERDLHDLRQCLPEQSWHPSVLPRLRALQLMQLLAMGRRRKLRAVLDAPLPPGCDRGIAWAHLLYAWALAEAADGQADVAVRMLHECGRRCLAAGHRNPALLPWRSQLALLEHGRGRDTVAAPLLRAERLAAERWGAAGAVALTELRASLLHPDAVSRADRAVVALWAAMRGSWSAETLLTLERAAAERRGSPAADAALRAAGRIGPGHRWSMRAGGKGLAPAVKSTAARRDADRPAEARTTKPGGSPGALSAAQLRVAELAANGLSNAAIAEILAITKRTVELHLSNAYRTLGISGRSQLGELLSGATGEHSAVC
ncbi:helix-turn-helix transcriptional regulator [Dactylosporangium aurantiacum]|uniref:Helix-turn-helix transcriptional regulator n=1 Tax=Dactylosporangium aurantiacum TaxID=35754 RepID=A0A9Q9I7A8_9ACTN|nr:helix-turn-helix transcriptional regulator [Dactylosporangium aurantiacum]MDG6106848.1 helix-turn-helix transcriptional regulator [Dactylosporangium aurantiacum]UWZ50984.1 helix-turn-helix transcriptional regulator [Dactylosporangium aurantiacum]